MSPRKAKREAIKRLIREGLDTKDIIKQLDTSYPTVKKVREELAKESVKEPSTVTSDTNEVAEAQPKNHQGKTSSSDLPNTFNKQSSKIRSLPASEIKELAALNSALQCKIKALINKYGVDTGYIRGVLHPNFKHNCK